MRERALDLVKNIAIIFAVGIVYYIFYLITRIGIKCPFYLIFGYLCPGCGLSRMFLALLQLDFPSAVYYNAGFLAISPLLCCVFGNYCYRYIKHGSTGLVKWHKVVLIVCAVVLIVFGIIRNTHHIGLHPSYNEDYEFSNYYWRYI